MTSLAVKGSAFTSHHPDDGYTLDSVPPSTTRLLTCLEERKPIVGAAVGTGLAAAAAESAEADLLMVLSASYFRSQGVPSAASLLPFANANEMTLRIAQENVMPRVMRTPVFIGVCAQALGRDFKALFAQLQALGIAGVTNFPTVAFFEGQYREELEVHGEGFACEVAFLKTAKAAGFMTIGFCLNSEQAAALAEVDVDILCLSLGITEWRVRDLDQHQAALDVAVARVNTMMNAAEASGKVPFTVVFGGPVVLPQDTAQIYQRTRASGYIGGSAIERFPASAAITQAVRDFRYAATPHRKVDRLGAIIGAGPAMSLVFDTIRSVAASDATVLLVGESGTGKELAAREIHRLSRRHQRPLVSWNCGATSESLAMTELFGHEKGAFTGALRAHAGKFEQAEKGTLFMDEVTDLPASAQASLLRVIQEREMVRVGGEKPVAVDVRLIAASNKPFEQIIPAGQFRLDLYYRLSTVVLRIPPLRERSEDIPFLVWELVQEFAQKYEAAAPRIPDSVMDILVCHTWPGNIRELRNTIERLFLLGKGKPLTRASFEKMFAAEQQVSHLLASHQMRSLPEATPKRVPNWPELRARLKDVLARHDGNKTAAARELGVTRKTIHKWVSNDHRSPS